MHSPQSTRDELNRYEIPRSYRYAWSQWRLKPSRRTEKHDDFGFVADRMTALYILLELDEIHLHSTHRRSLLPASEKRKPGRPKKSS